MLSMNANQGSRWVMIESRAATALAYLGLVMGYAGCCWAIAGATGIIGR